MRNFLRIIERVGNRLPDPATLFAAGTLLVLLVSHVAVVLDWQVAEMRPVDTGAAAPEWQETGVVHRANSLLTSDGILWVLKNLRKHFMEFPPLGVVLVAMLGIGVAERSGFIPALLRLSLSRLPGKWLTPATVFLGIISTVASDAGYIVLPPLAAVVYISFGRHPLAGIAAAFAGVSAGFNANLMLTSLDPMLSELTQNGARVVDAAYTVSPASNWYFMIASTFALTAAGWWATEKIVEPNLMRADGGKVETSAAAEAPAPVSAHEARGVLVALGASAAFFAVTLAAILIPGAPLHGVLGETLAGPGENPAMPRWIVVVVPLLFFALFVPGLAYGVHQKLIRNDKDVARLFTESIASMAPIIVLAFFAGQFIFCFQQSGLGRMLAEAGGQALSGADLPAWALLVVFVAVVGVFNLLIGSMSAKYAIFAPIFVPMFMMVGISPELTQAAYRIGDSVTNIITPLNAYLIIVITFIQRYQVKAGMGTLISLMLPYTLVFTAVWVVMLVAWVVLGLPLGPQGQGPLVYP
jgi:aminobenzoyl-glutamate transport protein